MNVLRSKRAVAGLGAALVTIVGVTLFVVLPALASNSGDRIPPPATSGLLPVDVPLGGNGTCSNLFTSAVSGLPSLHEYDNVNPGTATGLSSGNGDGVKFNLTLSGPNQKQVLLLTSTNAAIAGVGIKGGSESAVYDYTGREYAPGVLPSKWVTGDGNLHAPASKYTVSNGIENPSQWYGISQMTVCYRVLAPISGTVFNDANGTGLPAGQAGLNGVTVTLVDNTTGYQTTVMTPSNGTFSFNQPVGDSYTVCSASPSGYQESAPTTGATCTTGAPTGYLHPVPSTGSTTNNFGFRPAGSVAGTVYNDVNQNLSNDDGSPLSGWTVTLYGGAQPVSTTTDQNGSYKINAAFSTSTTYTLCETPTTPAAGHTWAQDVPLPSSATICGPNKNGNGASTSELLKGLQFTPGTVSDTITGKDFGNVDAVTCNPDGSVPSPNPGTYDVNIPPSSCATGGSKASTGFVVDSGVQNGTPFVSVWTGDSQGTKVPLLEHINFPNALNQDGTLKYTHLEYTDAFPFTGALVTMPSCQVDPRDPTNSTKLATSPIDYSNQSTASQVLPSGATSCVISLAPSGTVGTPGFLVADVYSDVDGLRQPG